VQEFTLTNPLALDALRRTLGEVEAFSTGEATLGVGSVRCRQQAEHAIEAGAHFVVTPIYSSEVIQCCTAVDVPVFSGAFTPTEIHMAWQSGASIVKVFPARGLGPRYIQDVLAPMPDLRLMPTGGVDLKNLKQFLDAGAVAVGVGGSLLDARAIGECDWDRISSMAKSYVDQAKEVADS
jgi:2-dehydro-3-deoxyphosphogluconate aldolase/(4S)-4-hydroxy-2-oxoglutarate aldolase